MVSELFIDQVYKALGINGTHRNFIEVVIRFSIKENYSPYNAHVATEMGYEIGCKNYINHTVVQVRPSSQL